MCLVIDKEKTKKQFSLKKDVFTFYKEFNDLSWRNDIKLETAYTHTIITERVVSVKKRSESIRNIGANALHAWVNQRSRPLIIPIIVKKQDIIAFGIENDVAVVRYEISEVVWKKLGLQAPSNPNIVKKEINALLEKQVMFDYGYHMPLYDRWGVRKVHRIDRNTGIFDKRVYLSCAFGINELVKKIKLKVKKIKNDYDIFVNYNLNSNLLGAVIYEK